jgi:lipopolysaccharide export system protein LptC
MDQHGEPSLKIISPKIVHYAENDTADIEQPLISIYHQSPIPWHIKSRYAKATQGISTILFWDQVVIDHPADHNTATTLIKTTRLTITPTEKRAQTDQWITLQQPGIVAQGIGMLANLRDGTIHLLSAVEGAYDAA